MKTLSYVATLLALLLAVNYCGAVGHAVNEMTPAPCCFKFFTGRIPVKQIVSIVKTDARCQERGFVIGTARGNRICVSQSVPWAQTVFDQQQGMENRK